MNRKGKCVGRRRSLRDTVTGIPFFTHTRRALKISETQTQLVLPNTLDDKDLRVAKQLADIMDLRWEELPKGLKIFQGEGSEQR